MLEKHKWLKEGSIISLPKKDNVRKELLEFICESDFEWETWYTEKDVNEKLKKRYFDYVFLRRLMISYKILERKRDCSRYWRS